MKGKIFVALLISLLSIGALVALSNPTISLRGIFPLQNGWSGDGGTSFTGGGYPGVVNFDVGGGMILSGGTLTGSFWLGNVGWVSFAHGILDTSVVGDGLAIPRINCPASIWTGTTQPCPMSGYAWSQNAGWIALAQSDIGVGSGVYFNPNTGNLE